MDHAERLLPPNEKEAAAFAADFLARSFPVLAATEGLNGRPEIRPVIFLFAENGALYFLTAKNRRFYAELCRAPHICLTAYDRENEVFLRIAGKVCFSEDEPILDRAVRERPELLQAFGGEPKALIVFFLLEAKAELLAGLDEIPQAEFFLPDPSGVLTGITIKKKTELRDRIAKILERREAEPPALPEETAKLYDGALFLFAEAAKALWPRMDIRPIERAAVFETWDEREKYTKLAARIIGNAVIDKPEDLTYLLDPERLAELRKGRTPQE